MDEAIGESSKHNKADDDSDNPFINISKNAMLTLHSKPKKNISKISKNSQWSKHPYKFVFVVLNC